MRSNTHLDQTGFSEVVVESAQAWRNDDSALAQEKLTQAFQCLEAARDHFYPVECWCLDLVLFSESSISTLQSELQSPVPASILADTNTVDCFDKSLSNISDLISEKVANGSLSVLGSVSEKLPLALMSPEQLDREVADGRAAWQKAAGVLPQIFGCHAGPRASIFCRFCSGLDIEVCCGQASMDFLCHLPEQHDSSGKMKVEISLTHLSLKCSMLAVLQRCFH